MQKRSGASNAANTEFHVFTENQQLAVFLLHVCLVLLSLGFRLSTLRGAFACVLYTY
jgi:hypothetical protein